MTFLIRKQYEPQNNQLLFRSGWCEEPYMRGTSYTRLAGSTPLNLKVAKLSLMASCP